MLIVVCIVFSLFAVAACACLAVLLFASAWRKTGCPFDMIRDNPRLTSWFLFFAWLAVMSCLAAATAEGFRTGYRIGQVDALCGVLRYELTTRPGTEVRWRDKKTSPTPPWSMEWTTQGDCPAMAEPPPESAHEGD